MRGGAAHIRAGPDQAALAHVRRRENEKEIKPDVHVLRVFALFLLPFKGPFLLLLSPWSSCTLTMDRVLALAPGIERSRSAGFNLINVTG